MLTRAAFHRRARSQRRKKRRPGRGRQRSNDRGSPPNSEGGNGTEDSSESAAAAAAEENNSEEEIGGGDSIEGTTAEVMGTDSHQDEGGKVNTGDAYGEEVAAQEDSKPSGDDAGEVLCNPAETAPTETAATKERGSSADRFAGSMVRLPVFSGIASESPAADDGEEKAPAANRDNDENAVDETGGVVDSGGAAEESASDALTAEKDNGGLDPNVFFGLVSNGEATGVGTATEGNGNEIEYDSPNAPLFPVANRTGPERDLAASSDASPPSPPSAHGGARVAIGRARSLLTLPSFLPSLRAGSSAGAVANLCGATLGAGVLSLPFAFSHAGLVLGASLLLLTAFSTIRSIGMLVEACDTTGAAGFEALSLRLCGPRVMWLVEGCIFIFCYGTAIAYIVAVGDMLQQAIIGTLGNRLPDFVDRAFCMTLFWAAIMFPLSLSRRIDKLRYASVVGIGSVGFLVLAAAVHSARDLAVAGTPVGGDAGDVFLWPASLRNVLRACPIIIFAFSCQVNVCAIYHDLGAGRATATSDADDASNGGEHPVDSPRSKFSRMVRVTELGVLVCVSLYIAMGLCGYLDFGKLTQDNVLKNYCVQDTRDPLMIFAFICITVTVVMAFPLNILPARATVDGVLRRLCDSRQADECVCGEDEEVGLGLEGGAGELSEPLLQPTAPASDGSGGDAIAVDDHGFGDINDLDFEVVNAPSDDEHDGVVEPPSTQPSRTTLSDLRHAFLTLLISGSALLVALEVPDISVVFGLMGGTASSLISFILPGTFTLKILAESEQNHVGTGGGYLNSGSDRESAGSSHTHIQQSKLRKKWESWVLIICGTVIGVLSTAVTVHSIYYEDPIPGTCSSDNSTVNVALAGDELGLGGKVANT